MEQVLIFVLQTFSFFDDSFIIFNNIDFSKCYFLDFSFNIITKNNLFSISFKYVVAYGLWKKDCTSDESENPVTVFFDTNHSIRWCEHCIIIYMDQGMILDIFKCFFKC